MKKYVVGLVAGLALASAASAQHNLSGSAFGPMLDNVGGFGTATGSQVDTGNAVFSNAGGAVMNFADPFHTIGTTEPMNNALGRPSTVSSTVTTVGNLRTVTISWTTDAGAAMIQPGDNIGGAHIHTVSFELGSANFPAGGIVDPNFDGFDHAADPGNPGVFLASFDLLDAAGGVIFSGNWFVEFDSTTDEIWGRTFLSAGGSDLAGFNIGGGEATVSYFITTPTPGALALLGLAGLVSVRRRRN